MSASTLCAALLASLGWVKRTANQRELLFCDIKKIDAVLTDAKWVLEERADHRNALAVWVEANGRRSPSEVEVQRSGETLFLRQMGSLSSKGSVCIRVRVWGTVPEVRLFRLGVQEKSAK